MPSTGDNKMNINDKCWTSLFQNSQSAIIQLYAGQCGSMSCVSVRATSSIILNTDTIIYQSYYILLLHHHSSSFSI